MITVAICLIYYGVAVWLYQVYLWFSKGAWVPIPVLTAWQAGFGVPSADYTFLGAVFRWLLSWPLSLTLILVGGGLLGAVAGWRRWRLARQRRMRRAWLAEQCAQAGYKPWAVSKILADLDAPVDGAENRRRAG